MICFTIIFCTERWRGKGTSPVHEPKPEVDSKDRITVPAKVQEAEKNVTEKMSEVKVPKEKTSDEKPAQGTPTKESPEDKCTEDEVTVERDEEGSMSEEEEKSVTQNRELIAHLHKVLEEEKVFLRPDIRIDDVARMLLTNRTYVTRLMRQEYGLTFIEYVNVARIQYSQGLLYTTDMTLDEIAEKSGFQSTSNYCRAFKRYTGATPKGWQQETIPS